MGGIDLKVVNDCAHLNVPLLSGQIFPTQVELTNWSSKLHLEMELGIKFDYFNSKVSIWEPLVEDFLLYVELGKASALPSAAMNFKLTAEKRMEVTVSYTFVQIALATSTLWASDLLVRGSNLVERRGHVPFEIKNDLGVPIKFWSSNTNTPETVTLNIGESKKWTPEARELSSNVQGLSLQIIGGVFGTVTDIPIEQEGLQLVALRPAFQGIDYK